MSGDRWQRNHAEEEATSPGRSAHLSACQFPSIEALSILRLFFFFFNWNSLRQSVPPSSDSVWLLQSCHLAWPGASVIVECGAGQLHYSALRLTVQVLTTRRPGEALTKAEGK